jgi:hypothetical protein
MQMETPFAWRLETRDGHRWREYLEACLSCPIKIKRKAARFKPMLAIHCFMKSVSKTYSAPLPQWNRGGVALIRVSNH